MSVTIANTTFDSVSYDVEGDVLYLHVGDARSAVNFDASAESHALRYDDSGRLVGVTILNAKLLLERAGEVRLTLRDGQVLVVKRPELEPALAQGAGSVSSRRGG